MSFDPVYWIVLNGGEVIGAADVFVEHTSGPSLDTEIHGHNFHLEKYTNYEVRDEQGRFWRHVAVAWMVANDGTMGRLFIHRGWALTYADHVKKIMAEAAEEAKIADYQPAPAGNMALGIAAMLNGTGTREDTCAFADLIIRYCKNTGDSMANAVCIFENALEGVVEDAMKHRNSVVDEMGYVEEMWWAGWDEFKRPQAKVKGKI